MKTLIFTLLAFQTFAIPLATATQDPIAAARRQLILELSQASPIPPFPVSSVEGKLFKCVSRTLDVQKDLTFILAFTPGEVIRAGDTTSRSQNTGRSQVTSNTEIVYTNVAGDGTLRIFGKRDLNMIGFWHCPEYRKSETRSFARLTTTAFYARTLSKGKIQLIGEESVPKIPYESWGTVEGYGWTTTGQPQGSIPALIVRDQEDYGTAYIDCREM